jgi:chorismate synthase
MIPFILHLIREAKSNKDSLGGTITCVIRGLPVGLGEPTFDKFHSELSKAVMSIPAVKGFEIGGGFEACSRMTGSEMNDQFVPGVGTDGRLRTATNHSGGVQGGITNGQTVYFRIALKPVSSVGITQATTAFDGTPASLTLEGRHDPCVLPRAPQIVESMTALSVYDMMLRNRRYERD